MSYTHHTARYQDEFRQERSRRQSFHHPHTSLGATGHWARTAGILSPLVISEFVKDPEKRWRYVRLASVATALASEAMWTYKIHKERETGLERCEALSGHEHSALAGQKLIR